MGKKRSDYLNIVPVLFNFFIMGFCDVVGITSSHVKEDLLGNYSPQFTDTLSNLIPVALFSMFLFFSIPTGLLMNKIGRKKTVLLSNVITVLAMLVPLISYQFSTCLVAFMLLGISNTILQVSLNPLLTNVVSGNGLTSILTAGQFVKAVSSFCAPFIAAFAASRLGNWQYIFPIYATITFIVTIWLIMTPIADEKSENQSSSFSSVLQLLADKQVVFLFLGILFVVGVDVGINTASPKLLMERCKLNSIDAGYGPSIYFAFRTAGAFIGAFLLTRMKPVKYFRLNIVFAFIALLALAFLKDKITLFVLFAMIGFTIANIFSIIYSLALQRKPNNANEISGLMITGVFGGAVIPFFMGLVSDGLGSQLGSVIVILCSAFYLLICAFSVKEQ